MMQDVATQHEVKALPGERQMIGTRASKTALGKLAPCENEFVWKKIDSKQFGFALCKEEQIPSFATSHFKEALSPAWLNTLQQGLLSIREIGAARLMAKSLGIRGLKIE
jgi:hypothetical protein